MSKVDIDDWYISCVLGVLVKDGKFVKLVVFIVVQSVDDVIWIVYDGMLWVLLFYQMLIYVNDLGFWLCVDEFDIFIGKCCLVQVLMEGVMLWYVDGGGVVWMGVGYGNEGCLMCVLYCMVEGKNFCIIDCVKSCDDVVIVLVLFLFDGNYVMMIVDDDKGFSMFYEFDLVMFVCGKVLFVSLGYDIGGLVMDEIGYGLFGVSVNE